MTIENPGAFLASIWDWGFLSGCFPRGAMPTDIDGITEVGGVGGCTELGGYFLVLEGKAPGVPVKNGQRRVFDSMLCWNRRVDSLFTVIVFWGVAHTNQISAIQFWPNPPFPGDADALKAYVSAWAEWAEERAAIRQESEGPK